uniref:Secreted protein n=1 Tax=Panagrellus redivivus TaxID=6233 RepID=A0A7E4WCD9_PANRE
MQQWPSAPLIAGTGSRAAGCMAASPTRATPSILKSKSTAAMFRKRAKAHLDCEGGCKSRNKPSQIKAHILLQKTFVHCSYHPGSLSARALWL